MVWFVCVSCSFLCGWVVRFVCVRAGGSLSADQPHTLASTEAGTAVTVS